MKLKGSTLILNCVELLTNTFNKELSSHSQLPHMQTYISPSACVNASSILLCLKTEV